MSLNFQLWKKQLLLVAFLIHAATTGAQAKTELSEVFQCDYPQRITAMIRWFHGQLRNRDGSFKSSDLGDRKAVIDKFAKAAIQAGDQKAALFAKVTFHSHLLQYSRLSEEEAVANTERIAKEGARLGFKYAEIQSYQDLSFYFGSKKQLGKQMYYAIKAFELYKNLHVDEYPYKKYALYTLALEYSKLASPSTAMKYALLASEVKGTELECIYLNQLLGVLYRDEAQWEKAQRCFEENKMLAGRLGYSGWQAISNGHIGMVLAGRGMDVQAQKYLQVAADSCTKYGITDNAILFKLEQASLLRKKSAVSALKYLNSEVLKQQMNLVGTAEHKELFFKIAASCSRESGNLKAALMFTDSLNYYSVLAEKKRDLADVSKAQMQLEQERYRFILQEQELEHRNKNILLGSAVLIVALVLSSALVFIFKQKQRAVQGKRVSELEREKVQLEMEAIRLRMNELMMLMQQRNFELAQLKKDSLWELQTKSEDPDLLPRERLRGARIITEDDWQRFMALFETTYEGYLHKVTMLIPEITPAELRYLALNRLHLSNKEIADMLGVGASAVRSTKSRLRKKLPPDFFV